MKKILLGALLVSGLAGQSAFAEIRTFDFTASVSSLITPVNANASQVAGIDAGTFVKKGDVIKGTFTFDDLDRDWVGANKPAISQKVLDFSFTFEASGTTVDIGNALWGHTPNAFNKSTFTLGGANLNPTVTSLFTLISPRNGFSWELDNDTAASLTLGWLRPGVQVALNANVTSLTEVSPVPEPSTYAMLLLGAAVVTGAAKRRAARRAA